jgi:hypothetical protein
MTVLDAEARFHVLAVDDSIIDRKLIEMLLRNSSYQGAPPPRRLPARRFGRFFFLDWLVNAAEDGKCFSSSGSVLSLCRSHLLCIEPLVQ